MNKALIIKRTAKYVESTLSGEHTGHDWWHIYRVWQNAKHIGRHEKVNMFVVELAALLHDIADWKLHGTSHKTGPEIAANWLKKNGVDAATIKHVSAIMHDMTYRGPKAQAKELSREGQVVQDADRLEAMGAIGIARVFAFGPVIKQPIHVPGLKPHLYATAHQYRRKYTGQAKNKREQGSSINHFYEKLLLLKDLMNTPSGKKLAAHRHQYMLDYLREFFQEWDGRK